jgi:hypothetical protein
MLPGDFFRRNVVLSFQEDAIGIRLRDVIGVDNMMWGSDYPQQRGGAILVALAGSATTGDAAAAELVGTRKAERRVLRLTNPKLPGVSASNTLVANIQIVMPEEIARAHRHSAAAFVLIIEVFSGGS